MCVRITSVFPKPNGVQKAGMHMKWSGYAGVQYRDGHAAIDPLKSFYANYATTTMALVPDVGDTAPCHGVGAAERTSRPKSASPSVPGIPSFAPVPILRPATRTCTTRMSVGGGRTRRRGAR